MNGNIPSYEEKKNIKDYNKHLRFPYGKKKKHGNLVGLKSAEPVLFQLKLMKYLEMLYFVVATPPNGFKATAGVKLVMLKLICMNTAPFTHALQNKKLLYVSAERH